MSEIEEVADAIDHLEGVIERLAQAEKHTAMELAKLQDQVYYVAEVLNIATNPERVSDNALLKEAYDKYMFTLNLVIGKN